MTPEQIAKMQAGRAAALVAKRQAELSEDDWHETKHIEAYLDLLRYRAQNDAIAVERSESDFLNIE